MTSKDNPGGPPAPVPAGDAKPRPTRRRPGPSREPKPPAPLIATPGPEPTTPLADVRLAVGRFGAPHGLKGHLQLHLTTDDPEHLATVKRVYLDGEDQPRRVSDVRWHGNELLLQLAGVRSPEAARELTGRLVRIAGSDARPLAPGEYLLYQLIGLTVVDPEGNAIGTVTDLMETGANDVLVITPTAGGAALLVPNIPDYVLEIRPEEGRMIATLPAYFGE